MTKKITKGKFSHSSFLGLTVLVIGLAAGVVGLQKTKNLTSSKASSGCIIVQTDQGPGCWCSSGGWQFHCGVAKGEPAPDQCIADCQDKNTDDTDNTPKAEKCDQGKTGGVCSGQYQYSCGGDGCKAECNNYPKAGRWILTGTKNCGKPGDIKPKPSGVPTPTPTPTPRTGQCNILDLQTLVDYPIQCNSGGGLTNTPPSAYVRYTGNCSRYKLKLAFVGASPETPLTNAGTQTRTEGLGISDFDRARSNFCDRKSESVRAEVVRSDNDVIFRQAPTHGYVNFTNGGPYDCYGSGRFCNGY